ncbi:O-antigen ligase-like membrane protein [Ancylomarina subtilis]|uniref:O-antigen ligase-like membrane protein n=1 Tax=Ancylomarina subtilis TaxID=1639035 RepID=A0A4Q7VJV1_9BACT|nr:O-antigen ligase family protein [Ancylomarina subtilis]RZT96490.1 O-antigen ligase-like membrane protein [Ancylomarina subtilis]
MGFKIKRLTNYHECLFFVVIILSIIVDMINGYLQNIVGIDTPIGVIFRGVVMIFLFYSYLKSRLTSYKFVLTLNIILFFIASIIWYLLEREANIFLELNMISKLFYFYLFLIYIERYEYRINTDFSIKLGVYWGIISCSINILCFFTGIGVKSYGDDFGFGVKAFFTGGNDFSLACIMSLSLAILYLAINRNLKSYIILLIIVTGTLLIGTRSVIISVPLILITSVFYIGFIKDKQLNISRKTRLFYKWILGGGIPAGIFYLGYWFIHNLADDYVLERMTTAGFKSARGSLIEGAISSINNFNGLEWIFGRGFTGSSAYVGNYMSLTYKRMIEADFHEIISSYGWFFGSSLLFIFVSLFFKSFRFFVKETTFLSIILFLSFSLIIGHSIFAGHVVFNAMLVPFFGIFYLLLLKETNAKNV